MEDILRIGSRHGSRNQHRHKYLVRWIAETFPNAIQTCQWDRDNSEPLTSVPHIMDIAGGKGELAARLTICHKVNVVMIDPRKADVPACFMKNVYGSLPKKWQERISEKGSEDLVSQEVGCRFKQLVRNFDEQSIKSCLELQNAVTCAKLLVGMHADGATESIVDIALKFRKPFVVVPCCVFPNFFRERLVVDEDTGNTVPVRSHKQFCQYLKNKDSHFVMEVLPFEGRNVGVWWDGKICDSDLNCDEVSIVNSTVNKQSNCS